MDEGRGKGRKGWMGEGGMEGGRVFVKQPTDRQAGRQLHWAKEAVLPVQVKKEPESHKATAGRIHPSNVALRFCHFETPPASS